MLDKDDINNFQGRIMRDRTLRFDKTFFAQVCEQSKLACELVPLNQQLQADIFQLSKRLEENEDLLAMPEAPSPIAELGLVITAESLQEFADNPLTDVPANGTLVAGGQPPCDTKTPKSTPPSLPKAKTTQR